uniref:Uncharacterized protein n=1 Tax=Timema monikensis TaxID=170555 RepID=A0A7R9EMN9_9NEOP|nr:unnamed protein product [Timema monikensis]
MPHYYWMQLLSSANGICQKTWCGS